MYALPTVVIKAGQASFHDGSLIKLPTELQSRAQLQYYQWQCGEGWSVCPQGFHVFSKTDEFGTRFVVPGLTIIGRKNSAKRFYEKRLELRESQVLDFVMGLTDEERRIEDRKNGELSVLIHDLRGFSSAIYNAAEEARGCIASNNQSVAMNRIESVIAAQILLSIRIDLLDFSANQITLDATDIIAVYKKVDKVVRCFRPKARAKHVSLTIEGQSSKRTLGPPIFELIIYSVIENAIKYSPSQGRIRVVVKDHATDISINVISNGPKISRSERTKIFEKGFRSRHAELTNHTGTGLGLHSAKRLLEENFQGSITVHQSGVAQVIGGVDYLETEFEIIVPDEFVLRH